jgi:hypothetical protein
MAAVKMEECSLSFPRANHCSQYSLLRLLPRNSLLLVLKSRFLEPEKKKVDFVPVFVLVDDAVVECVRDSQLATINQNRN